MGGKKPAGRLREGEGGRGAGVGKRGGGAGLRGFEPVFKRV
jgi:hypothetical protein